MLDVRSDLNKNLLLIHKILNIYKGIPDFIRTYNYSTNNISKFKNNKNKKLQEIIKMLSYHKNCLFSLRLKIKQYTKDNNFNQQNIRPEKLNINLNKYRKIFKNKISINCLPVKKNEYNLIKLIENSDVLLVIGETGSGKTTQIPQIIYKNFQQNFDKIICMEPRRIAAINAATRVADEMHFVLGDKIGYKIRYENMTNNNTKVKFVTNGMFLREFNIDSSISFNTCFIIDEVHERSIEVDIILGITKNKYQEGSKIIIMSATLEVKKFLKYFKSVTYIYIKGIIHPVFIQWIKKIKEDSFTMIIKIVTKIYHLKKKGHILIFLSGQEEIDLLRRILYYYFIEKNIINFILLPFYTRLSKSHKDAVLNDFDNNLQKCILSTNIAETSITIKNIKYVIDLGIHKSQHYFPNLLSSSLQLNIISKSSAIQRTGRAGRTQEGVCFRLYTKRFFQNIMKTSVIPDIKRLSLNDIIITIKNLKINSFQFFENPSLVNLQSSIYHLWLIDLLDSDGNLTKDGHLSFGLGVPSIFSKLILNSIRLKCSEKCLTLIGILSNYSMINITKSNLFNKTNHEIDSIIFRAELLIKMEVFYRWKSLCFSKSWVTKNAHNLKAFMNIRKIRKHLKYQLFRCNLKLNTSIFYRKNLLKSLTSVYFINTSILVKHNKYKTLMSGITGFLDITKEHPLIDLKPKLILFCELVINDKIRFFNTIGLTIGWILKYGHKIFRCKLNYQI